ncbi:serine hydrolase domain-containing protein [Streptomyces sp. NPDC000594]|uniref:serine hydrolase domain-containing protein n=1 Tax=Streptomyces sp. NPDC000594 TaxID=3154261 RepID=UPI003317F6A5
MPSVLPAVLPFAAPTAPALRTRPSRRPPLCLLLAVLLGVLVTGTGPVAHAAVRESGPPGPERYAAIDTFVRERMAATGAPGVAYAVVGPDGPLHQRALGTDGRGGRVTGRTPFLWGSVAKPVAATAVMALAEEGRLALDDRVVEHLPGFRFGGPAHASRVTVRQLLGHTAGIPASATLRVTDCHDTDCPRPAGRLAELDGVEPLGPPGAAYAYSSASYLILAAVVEAATGRSFADELRRSVLRPAGMDGAIADRATARARDLSPGHQPLWGVPAAVADGYDDHGAAYGYLGGDLGDLAAFAAFQLRSTRTPDGRAVLSPDSVRLMREEGRTRPDGEPTGYGLGWRVGGPDASLDRAVWHTGGSPGHSAMVFLFPERGTALVLQQNLYGLLQDEAVMEVGFGAARILTGGTADGTDGPSAAVHHLVVWGTTGVAAALLVAAVRAGLLLRRPRTGRRYGAVATALWCLAAALPWTVVALVADRIGLGQLLIWVPDAAWALGAATAAGTATALLRLILVVRGRTAGAPPFEVLEQPREGVSAS